MKNTLILLVIIALNLHLKAQDINLLNQIQNANGKITSFEADLTNTLIKSGKATTQNGTLCYVKPYEFSALFNTGKYTIANDKNIKMDIGVFHGTFKVKDGGKMQSLANVFLFGFQGRAQDLANEHNYSLTTKTENGYHIVCATTTKKRLIGIGFKQVIYKYQVKDLLIKEIELINYRGNSDTYTISNVKYNVDVDRKRFQF